ncbi:hypothetical protein [Paraburkholderia sp. BCC1885]|uniref:hypothetical protein n=1 Tax=Paraburkholderia sp. BCC1885 TaxID=2562669 RepID=UPI0011846574|nr:hypothetical protein [Paraburkholderia sp. BCC1885]
MSTSISSSNGAALVSVPIPQATSGSTVQTGSSQLNGAEAAGMILPRLAAGVAAANVSQLELTFGQILQSATSVDPSTGQREMSATADSQLSAALNTFLVGSGFTQEQADAASKGFDQELAEGEPISLSATFAGTGTNAFSVSAGYGSQTTSVSGVSVNERSGSVSIEFDPTTGKLSISLLDQRVSATSSVTQSGEGGSLVSLSLPPVAIVGVSSSQGDDSNGSGNEAVKNQGPVEPINSAAAPTDASSELNALIGEGSYPTLFGTQNALDLLGRMANAHQTHAEVPSLGAQAPLEGALQSAVVTIGFTQPLSIAKNNLNGHGTILFKRPDGSTGAMSLTPTSIEV